jgi:hypothetical protein
LGQGGTRQQRAERTAQGGFLRSLLLATYYLLNKIKNRQTGACSTYVEKRVACRGLVETLRERDHMKNLDINGNIILK